MVTTGVWSVLFPVKYTLNVSPTFASVEDALVEEAVMIGRVGAATSDMTVVVLWVPSVEVPTASVMTALKL